MTRPDTDLTVPFEVRFTHRLRFTEDVFGADSDVLADAIEPSEGRIPAVQFWVDEHVAAANPELLHRIRSLCARNTERFLVKGNIQQVSGGEDVKNDIHIIERMLKCFNHADLDRRSYVVVIGGGAVLDAVGFAAAIAHRGIRLIRLPTTTLAQGDSGSEPVDAGAAGADGVAGGASADAGEAVSAGAPPSSDMRRRMSAISR